MTIILKKGRNSSAPAVSLNPAPNAARFLSFHFDSSCRDISGTACRTRMPSLEPTMSVSSASTKPESLPRPGPLGSRDRPKVNGLGQSRRRPGTLHKKPDALPPGSRAMDEYPIFMSEGGTSRFSGIGLKSPGQSTLGHDGQSGREGGRVGLPAVGGPPSPWGRGRPREGEAYRGSIR